MTEDIKRRKQQLSGISSSLDTGMSRLSTTHHYSSTRLSAASIKSLQRNRKTSIERNHHKIFGIFFYLLMKLFI